MVNTKLIGVKYDWACTLLERMGHSIKFHRNGHCERVESVVAKLYAVERALQFYL